MGEHQTNPRADRPRCASCIHFNPGNVGEKHGHCQIKPPLATIMTTPGRMPGTMHQVEQSFWPPVLPEHFCGDHSDFNLWFAARMKERAN